MNEFVDDLNGIIDAVFDTVTRIVANFATNIVPLMVGVLPASITWYHIRDELKFDVALAWAGALVIEFLGFASASTLTEFYFHNRKYKDEKNHMALWTPALSFFWYLLIMIVFNILLSAYPGDTRIHIASIALFSTLAIPAYALVSSKLLYKTWRAEHRQSIVERKEERRRAKAEQRRADEEQSEQDRANDDLSTRPVEQKRVASEFREQIKSIAERQLIATGKYSPIGIARTLSEDYGMTQDPHDATGFISTYLKELARGNGHRNN